MNLTAKTMARTDWKRITERTYAFTEINDADFHGAAGLLHIAELRAPLVKRMGGVDVRIVDRGFDWLQLAPLGAHYWVTVMYDEMGSLTEYYFDVTYENHIEADGKSWFYDLYLDVVMLPDGELFLLDEDELEEALQNGTIDQAAYALAWETARALLRDLRGHEPEWRARCDRYRAMLK